MKFILQCFIIPIILLTSSSLYGQVGIGTTTPDASSVLDVFSTNKGLLIPRLTTVQRDLIVSPATGLMIYNTTLNNGELNIGTPSTPNWIGLKRPETPLIYTVTEGGDISTTSTVASLVTGMTVSPSPGTYIALFNAQMSGVGATSQSFGSAQGVTDLASLYDELMAYPGGVPHALTFGSGETLLPGVYNVVGAPSIAGTLTLAGGTATANPVFIIRGSGAFTTGVGTTVILTGNAKPENIFWVSGAAMATAANTTMKGTMIGGGIGAGAIAFGADTDLTGRVFSKLGAITMGANTVLTAPTGDAPVNLGVLSTFVMWSSAGAVSDIASATTTGDVGTAAGILSITGSHTGEKYHSGTIASTITTVNNATYSIYLNGVEVASSSRTIKLTSSVVSLQAMVTVIAENNPIEIRWKIDGGEATLKNRILSLIRSGN